MTLALFDLDNTLIAGDSDHLWGEFLVERGIVDARHYRDANDAFYRDYQAGCLDIHAYLRFALAVLTQHPVADLHRWRDEFLRDKITPRLLPAATDLLDQHRQQGHRILVITATNDFITAPIVEQLQVPELLATRVAMREGQYTGDIEDTPCYREGKVTRLNQWLTATGETLDGAWFYSDSHNDLPLLARVDHPVAVDPDTALAEEARQQSWPIISLRN